MSTLSCTSTPALEASLSEIERAIVAGAARALRARAAVQRKKAADGTAAAGEQIPRRHDPNRRGCRCWAVGRRI